MSDTHTHSNTSGEQYSPEARDVIFTVPNGISVLRIISIPVIAVLVSKHEMVASLIIIALSAMSDGLDGVIARKFNQVSKLGQILDPIADRLLIFCSILALGIAHVIPWWVLIVVGMRDLLMGVLIVMLAQHGYGPLPVHRVADFRRYLEKSGNIDLASGCLGHLHLGHRVVLARRAYLRTSGTGTDP